MKKMLFVMNPYSGMRRASKYLADIIALFNQADYETVVHMTRGQGDAIQIVKDRAKDMDLIVCCGGDGTFNETVTGILEAGADVPVGYIPAGSTNDFAASLKLSGNVMQAAQDILDGQPVPYDVGKFGDRYFSYVASFGIFSRASYATPQNVKNALGHLAYVLEGVKDIAVCKLTSADVVRHALVQQIINAYERAEKKKEEQRTGKTYPSNQRKK